MRNWLKDAGMYALGLLVFGVIFLGVGVLLHGMVWASEKLLPWLVGAGRIAFDVCLLALPLCLFRKTRPLLGTILFFASYFFGGLLFCFSCLVAVQIWGYVGLFVGLFIAGVGVVPVAFLASMFHGEWSLFWEIVFGITLTFTTRGLGIFLATRAPSKPEPSSEILEDQEFARQNAYRDIE